MKRYQIEELAHLYASEGLEGDALVAFEEWKGNATAKEKAEFRELVEAVTLLSLQEVAPVKPSAGVKDRLLAAIEDEEEPVGEPMAKESAAPRPAIFEEFAYLRAGEGEWTQLPVKGARIKELSSRDEDGVALFLLELEAGTKFPAHSHKGAEMAYVLSGDLETEDETLHAGDFMRAAPGSKHRHLHSQGGCRALLVTALDNYPKRAIGLFGRLAKAYEKVRVKVKGG